MNSPYTSPQESFFGGLQDLLIRVGQLCYPKPQPIRVVLKATNFSKRRNECFPGISGELPKRLLSQSDFDQILFVLQTATFHNDRGMKVISPSEIVEISDQYETYRKYFENVRSSNNMSYFNIYPNVAFARLERLAEKYKYTNFSRADYESVAVICDIIDEELHESSNHEEAARSLYSLYKIIYAKGYVNISEGEREELAFTIIWNGRLYSVLGENDDFIKYFTKLADVYHARYDSIESEYLIEHIKHDEGEISSLVPIATAISSWRGFGLSLNWLQSKAYYSDILKNPKSIKDGVKSKFYAGTSPKEFVSAMTKLEGDESLSPYIIGLRRFLHADILSANGLFQDAGDQMHEAIKILGTTRTGWWDVVLYYATSAKLVHRYRLEVELKDTMEAINDYKSKALKVMLDNKVHPKRILKFMT